MENLDKACKEGDVGSVINILSTLNNIPNAHILISQHLQHEKIISLLLNHIEDNNKMNAVLHQAAEYGNIEVLELAKKRGWNMNKEIYSPRLIHIASRFGRADAVSFVIENGVRVNEMEIYGTPLHYACESNHDCTKVVEVLLRHGAAVDKLNFYDYTPLCYSINRGKLQEVKVLLNHAADIKKCEDI